MINFVLILVCILAGYLFRRAGTLPAGSHKSINTWIIYLGLPAVSFKYLPHIHWGKELLVPALSPFIVWTGAWLFISIYKRSSGLEKKSAAGLRLTSGLSNTSFVGFPLILAYFSEQDISTAIICDQLTFMILASFGLVTAIRGAGVEEVSIQKVAKRVFTFPPFLGFIAALTLPHFVDLSLANPLFDKISTTVAPLALFSIGLQLKLKAPGHAIKHLVAALSYKLFIAPMLVLIFILVFRQQHHTAEISLFEAAMPVLLTSGVVADEYGLDPDLINLFIGISILLSLATTFLWFQVLQLVF